MPIKFTPILKSIKSSYLTPQLMLLLDRSIHQSLSYGDPTKIYTNLTNQLPNFASEYIRMKMQFIQSELYSVDTNHRPIRDEIEISASQFIYPRNPTLRELQVQRHLCIPTVDTEETAATRNKLPISINGGEEVIVVIDELPLFLEENEVGISASFLLEHAQNGEGLIELTRIAEGSEFFKLINSQQLAMLDGDLGNYFLDETGLDEVIRDSDPRAQLQIRREWNDMHYAIKARAAEDLWIIRNAIAPSISVDSEGRITKMPPSSSKETTIQSIVEDSEKLRLLEVYELDKSNVVSED